MARVKSDPVFSSTIGNFSGVIESDASWQLQDEVDGLELILPPQVVGEEFIHDYPSVAPQAFPFCFSPNAKFSLSRSVLEQNYTEAPWNLRKLLGWSNQRSLDPPFMVCNLSFFTAYKHKLMKAVFVLPNSSRQLALCRFCRCRHVDNYHHQPTKPKAHS